MKQNFAGSKSVYSSADQTAITRLGLGEIIDDVIGDVIDDVIDDVISNVIGDVISNVIGDVISNVIGDVIEKSVQSNLLIYDFYNY